MNMKSVKSIIGSVIALTMVSCSSYMKVEKSHDYVYKYEMAKTYYAEGYYNRSSLLLQEVVLSLKGTDKGEESLYLLAMANYKARAYDAAHTYFKKYYTSYPKGLFAEEAYFYSGCSLYNQVPETKLDQSATYEAVQEFQDFSELFPASRFNEAVQNYLFDLQDKLVEKEYLSAKLYYDLGSYFGNCANGGSNFQACIVTAENAIRDYPYTSRREEFAILILRAKFDLAKQSVESKKEERYHNAIDEYYGFTNEFPESKYMSEAQSLFAKAQKYVKDGKETETNE
ncbi:outer membrane assembly lipoprotein YfiO [gut metagenome]|uniref:Outer membrane assembly lipoprotein YfiO n=1 Tax=gut metagenome TaxID=749906 RepID=J9GK50_9ZZZZ